MCLRILQVFLILTWFAILYVFCWPAIANAADLPHYADLTFTDIPDLDARVDSALSIGRVDSMISGYEWNSTTNESRTVYHRWQVCRRFAGLTIMWMPEETRPGIWTYPPTRGKARLWWWEKED